MPQAWGQHKWRAKYGGLDVSYARRLKALEEEYAKPIMRARMELLQHRFWKTVKLRDSGASTVLRSRNSWGAYLRSRIAAIALTWLRA